MQVSQQNIEYLEPNLSECFIDICRSDYIESTKSKNHTERIPVCLSSSTTRILGFDTEISATGRISF